MPEAKIIRTVPCNNFRTPIKRVVLVNAPLTEGVQGSAHNTCYPPLGLPSIASHLNSTLPDVRVRVVDASIASMSEVLEMIKDADLVGISVLTPTYENGLAIAKAAKANGSFVLLGNDHASHYAGAIMRNRPYVDAIVWGDYGEFPTEMLIRAINGRRPFSEVPNMIWRDGREIVNNVVAKGYIRFGLNSVPIARRNPEEDQAYFSNYNRIYGRWHDGQVKNALINLARGCAWGASPEGKCSFCDIFDLSMRHVSPERAWLEIRYLTELGYNFLYEGCDSFTSFKRLIKELVKTKPKDLNPKLCVYARASEMSQEMVDDLKELGVMRVNMGLEAGDTGILNGLKKGNRNGVEANVKAVGLLSQNGLQAHYSFVLGGPGESEESLQNTVDFIKWVATKSGVVVIDHSLLLPIKGAECWQFMMEVPAFYKKYRGRDLIDTGEIVRDWFRGFDVSGSKKFPQVGYAAVLRYFDEITTITEERGLVLGGFGVRRGEAT